MKIALFHNLPSGGAKRVAYEHARRLNALGHTLDLYTFETIDERFLPLQECVRRTIRFPWMESPRRSGILPRMLRLRRIRHWHEEIAAAINREGYDVAYLHTCLVTGAPYAARALRVPSVYYCQEPLSHVGPVRAAIKDIGGKNLEFTQELIHLMKQRHERISAQTITRIIVNSYHSREFVMEVWGINASFCPLGVEVEQFSPDNTPREEFVLSVGALVPHKGFPFLVRSLGRLPEQIRPELVLVCNFEYPEQRAVVEAEAKRCKVGLRILVGVSEDQLVTWYRRAKLFLYAPYLEPFGLAPVEAMACGTPVIGVREGGVRETIANEETGILVDRDEMLFTDAVHRLLLNPHERQRMGRAGPAHVSKEWNWELSVNNLLWQFQKAIESYRGHTH
jgi:glycosyltransferase involved in cell wall biosynthesis